MDVSAEQPTFGSEVADQSVLETAAPSARAVARVCVFCGLACAAEGSGSGCPQCGRSIGKPSWQAGSSRAPVESLPREEMPPRRVVRNVPLRDLLTPKDVARAFQLNFGPEPTPPPPPAVTATAADAPAFWVLPKLEALRSVWLPSAAEITRRMEAIADNARAIAHVAAVFLLAASMTAAAITLAIGAEHAGKATLAWMASSPPHRVESSRVFAALPPAPVVAPVAATNQPPAPRLAAPQPMPIASASPAPAPAEYIDAEPAGTDDVQSLWMAALDAESHRKFATAVKLYDHIESLPSTCWPAGLRTRVSLARQELSGGTY